MIQLLQRNPDASPREPTVRTHVKAFREQISEILKSRGQEQGAAEEENSEEENVAKLVEEFKGMIRELPERLDQHASSLVRRGFSRERRIDPGLLEQFIFEPPFQELKNGYALSWMAVISLLRNDIPWLYEPGMDFYRALISGKQSSIKENATQMHYIIETSHRGPFRHLIDERKKMDFVLRRLHDLIERAAVHSSRAK